MPRGNVERHAGSEQVSTWAVVHCRARSNKIPSFASAQQRKILIFKLKLINKCFFFWYCNLLLIAGLGDTCNSNTECYLPDDGSGQHVECVGQICKCIAGYNPTPENRSCKSKLLLHRENGTQPKVEPTDYFYLISPVENVWCFTWWRRQD
jgi:hypothetical protein